MEERQSPSPDGLPKPPTLTSSLRRAFATRMDCHIVDVSGKMWEVLDGTVFGAVDDGMMASVVNGEKFRHHVAEGRCSGS